MSPIRPVAFVIFALSLLAFYTSVLEGKLAANDARAVGPPYTQRNNGPAIKVLKSVDSSSIAHRHFQRLNPSRRPRRSLNVSVIPALRDFRPKRERCSRRVCQPIAQPSPRVLRRSTDRQNTAGFIVKTVYPLHGTLCSRSLSVRVANRPQRVKAAPEQVTGVVFEPFSEVSSSHRPFCPH